MTPGEGAREILRMSRELERKLREAERETLAEAADTANQLSSGPFKQDQLTEMGHPYAWRDPRPPQDPAVINVQTGKFKKSWRSDPGEWAGDQLNNRLLNDDDPVTGRLADGTSLMIERPIQARIEQSITHSRERRLNSILSEVFF